MWLVPKAETKCQGRLDQMKSLNHIHIVFNLHKQIQNALEQFFSALHRGTLGQLYQYLASPLDAK